jgi:hypothetical protein
MRWVGGPLWWIGTVVLFPILATVGVMLGLWWAPFVFGLVFGVIQPRARIAIPIGALIGLLAWAIPLAGAQSRYGIDSTAESLAAIMGFGRQEAIPITLTLVVGLLLGLTGTWVGSAARSLLQPAISR